MAHSSSHRWSSKKRSKDVAAEVQFRFSHMMLDPQILLGLKKESFKICSPIQQRAIPLGRSGLDLLIQAKSGTGKTLAFAVIMLEAYDPNVSSPQSLVVVPTREIAVQIEHSIRRLAHYVPHFKIESFIGGMDIAEDRRKIQGCKALVGTPGRILHLMSNGVVKTSDIRMLVMDEADQLMSTSFRADIQKIRKRLPDKIQTLAVSATFGGQLDVDVAKMMNNPVGVTPCREVPILLGVSQFAYVIPTDPKMPKRNQMQDMQAKVKVMYKIFSMLAFKQCMIFSNSQSRAESFSNYLQQDGWPAEVIMGSQSQPMRLDIFKRFKTFQFRNLVATDLMARGVDSENVNLVINLEVPIDSTSYLHRIGRAGRFGSQGISITLLGSNEELEHMRFMLGTLGESKLFVYKFPEVIKPDEDIWQYSSVDVRHKIFGMNKAEMGNCKSISMWRANKLKEACISEADVEDDAMELVPCFNPVQLDVPNANDNEEGFETMQMLMIEDVETLTKAKHGEKDEDTCEAKQEVVDEVIVTTPVQTSDADQLQKQKDFEFILKALSSSIQADESAYLDEMFDESMLLPSNLLLVDETKEEAIEMLSNSLFDAVQTVSIDAEETSTISVVQVDPEPESVGEQAELQTVDVSPEHDQPLETAESLAYNHHQIEDNLENTKTLPETTETVSTCQTEDVNQTPEITPETASEDETPNEESMEHSNQIEVTATIDDEVCHDEYIEGLLDSVLITIPAPNIASPSLQPATTENGLCLPDDLFEMLQTECVEEKVVDSSYNETASVDLQNTGNGSQSDANDLECSEAKVVDSSAEGTTYVDVQNTDNGEKSEENDLKCSEAKVVDSSGKKTTSVDIQSCGNEEKSNENDFSSVEETDQLTATVDLQDTAKNELTLPDNLFDQLTTHLEQVSTPASGPNLPDNLFDMMATQEPIAPTTKVFAEQIEHVSTVASGPNLPDNLFDMMAPQEPIAPTTDVFAKHEIDSDNKENTSPNVHNNVITNPELNDPISEDDCEVIEMDVVGMTPMEFIERAESFGKNQPSHNSGSAQEPIWKNTKLINLKQTGDNHNMPIKSNLNYNAPSFQMKSLPPKNNEVTELEVDSKTNTVLDSNTSLSDMLDTPRSLLSYLCEVTDANPSDIKTLDPFAQYHLETKANQASNTDVKPVILSSVDEEQNQSSSDDDKPLDSDQRQNSILNRNTNPTMPSSVPLIASDTDDDASTSDDQIPDSQIPQRKRVQQKGNPETYHPIPEDLCVTPDDSDRSDDDCDSLLGLSTSDDQIPDSQIPQRKRVQQKGNPETYHPIPEDLCVAPDDSDRSDDDCDSLLGLSTSDDQIPDSQIPQRKRVQQKGNPDQPITRDLCVASDDSDSSDDDCDSSDDSRLGQSLPIHASMRNMNPRTFARQQDLWNEIYHRQLRQIQDHVRYTIDFNRNKRI